MLRKHFISSHRKRLQLLTQEHRMFSCRISDLFIQRWRSCFSCKSQTITYTSSEIEKTRVKCSRQWIFFKCFFFFYQSSLNLQIQQRNNGQCQKLIFSMQIKRDDEWADLQMRFWDFFFNLKVTVLLPACQRRQGREEIENLKCCSTKMQLVTHCFSEKKNGTNTDLSFISLLCTLSGVIILIPTSCLTFISLASHIM